MAGTEKTLPFNESVTNRCHNFTAIYVHELQNLGANIFGLCKTNCHLSLLKIKFPSQQQQCKSVNISSCTLKHTVSTEMLRQGV